MGACAIQSDQNHQIITILSSEGKLSIDRWVDLGLNSDDTWIDHVPVMLHNEKIVYNCVCLVMALLQVPQVWCFINS